MSRMPDDLAIRYGEILDQFEASLDVLNQSKADTIADLRADLKDLGMTGAEVSAEVAMLKGAVKLQRMNEADRQKAAAKDDGVADYVTILSLARARVRVRGEEHDAETGEITEREVPATVAAAGASPALTSIAAAQAANANGGGDDVAPPPAHAPEQPGIDHGSVRTPDAGGADASKIHEPVTTPTAGPSPAEVTEAGDRSATDPNAAPVVADQSKPNPICRDPDDCGVYASWAMPCEACKRAAAHRSAA